jgi:hypothetical protein
MAVESVFNDADGTRWNLTVEALLKETKGGRKG